MAFGAYTVVLSYDTRSPLGVLTSKRIVKVELPVYEGLAAKYEAAKKAGDAAKMADASRQVLAKWPNPKVKPGQALTFETRRMGQKPAPDQLKATISWRPGKEDIAVAAEVLDASFSVNEAAPHTASSISIYFAPSGFDDSATYYTIAPSGPEDSPIILSTGGGGPIKAKWQRTANGYRITAAVPYASLKSCAKDWKYMPVDAMVNSKTPGGRCALIVGDVGDVWQGSRFYKALARN